MSIVNGQPVDAANSNPSWISKNTDDTTPSKLNFGNLDPLSGPTFNNIQRLVNSIVSFLGNTLTDVYNVIPPWVTNNRGTSGDNVFQRVGAIDTAFHPTTGHKHTGTAGDAPKIDASSIANVPLTGYGQQGANFLATGTSTDVSSLLTGQTPSTSQTVEGVVVNAPFNRILIRNSLDHTEYKDSSGNIVFGRLTFAASVWTLSYFTDVSGTETAFSFPLNTPVAWFYQVLANALDGTAPVYSDLFFVPSDNATADIITATTSIQGKVSLGTASQSVGSANSGGTANASVANADHVHQGVHSLNGGGGQIYGDATLSAGSGISLTQVGQNIQINNTATTAIRAASQALALNDSSKAITFSSPLGSANYAVTAVLVNTVDSAPQFQPVTITAKSASGFTASWNVGVDSANYLLDYIATPYA